MISDDRVVSCNQILRSSSLIFLKKKVQAVELNTRRFHSCYGYVRNDLHQFNEWNTILPHGSYIHALLHVCFDCRRYVSTRIWIYYTCPTRRAFEGEKNMRLVNRFYLLFDDLERVFDVHGTRGAVTINGILHLKNILWQSLLNAVLKLLFRGGAAFDTLGHLIFQEQPVEQECK